MKSGKDEPGTVTGSESFSSLTSSCRAIWAKSGESGGHGLLAHMLDVAAVAEALLAREPGSSRSWAARAFGLPERQVARWVATLVGLHDFGKAIPGFQAKWPDGRARTEGAGLTFNLRSRLVTDHAAATAALLPALLAEKVDGRPLWVRHVSQAISAHHGYNYLAGEIGKARPHGEAPEWAVARRVLFDKYWAALAPRGVPKRSELSTPAVEWLGGLTSVADWIGSNPEWFPPGEREDGLAAHLENARFRAGKALDAIGWYPYRTLLDSPVEASALLCRVLRHREEIRPRPLQEAGARLLSDIRGPALLLVEAPMGEGKTELAFLAHLRLQASNQHRGLYLALPTQATGNAMYQRATGFLAAFAADHPLDIQLVHGGAGMHEHVTHLRSVNHSRDETVSASAWFSQRRRPLLSHYGVGTVDQALFAALNVKHHFVRLWGLGNRVVVLDEIHAYDTYTTGLIEALLRWLKAMDSSVVLMSATLPREKRQSLLQAWGVPADQVPDLSYPRLLVADLRGVRGESFASRPLPTIHVTGIDESVEDVIACADAQLRQGGCGAVIVNTVDRAQTVYSRMRASWGNTAEVLLFHARFPADRRSELEFAVQNRFGKDGSRPERALLVATQVVEQSLDIDFDFLITDLAPMDLILQRGGRLHRHERERPAAHGKARMFVAGLRPEHPPDLKETAWGYVYDPYILSRTWALLSREAALKLPRDIDRLVQSVYGVADLPDDLEEKARDFIEVESYGQHRARVGNERLHSLNVAIDPVQEPQTAYLQKPRGNEEGDGLGLRNRTRLGDDSIGLVPIWEVPGGWSADQDGTPFTLDVALSDQIASRLFARQIRLSNKAVSAHFAGVDVPEAFAAHPLLRHLKPMPLTAGRFKMNETLSLRLDDELGLVYESGSR